MNSPLLSSDGFQAMRRHGLIDLPCQAAHLQFECSILRQYQLGLIITSLASNNPGGLCYLEMAVGTHGFAFIDQAHALSFLDRQ